MEGQQPAEERAEVIRTLLVLATKEPDFLRDVRHAPASTLSRYGLTLRNQEMDEVVSYLIEKADLSDDQIIGDLQQYLGDTLGRWR